MKKNSYRNNYLVLKKKLIKLLRMVFQWIEIDEW